MNKIADYDSLDYNYKTYWSKRRYEHEAEVLLLNKLLKTEKGDWFLDIGGSYGRLLSTYSKKYSNCVIVDYSLKTLQKNYKDITKKYPNTNLIAANAYHLPFKKNTFDASLMVRVLHHLDKPQEYFNEVYSVTSSNGIYIQEFANKLHLKSVIKSLLTLNFTIFNQQPYQQPDRHNNEGARENSNVPFYNYHTSWIINKLSNTGFQIINKYGCSFLRLNILKKYFNINTLLFFENVFQNILSWSNISPSIFIKCIKNTNEEAIKSKSLEEILVCPLCKGGLTIENDKATCKECKKEYFKKENIWDYRV